MGKILGIVSSKGGVGKTSITICLAEAIASFGKKVLIVDGNFSSPNIGIYFGIIENERTIHNVLANKINIGEAVHELKNLDIIPASIFFSESYSPLLLKNKLKFLRNKYDYILIDSSPSINEETLSVMLASDELILVTTPDHIAIGNLIKTIKTARSRGIKIFGLIVNKSYNKKFEIPFDSIQEITEIPILAVIPYDLGVLKSLSRFRPYINDKPNSEGSEEFKKLAALIAREKYKPKRFKFLFRWPKKQDINRTIFYESVFIK